MAVHQKKCSGIFAQPLMALITGTTTSSVTVF
jgi:hypothetical protein